MKKILWLFTILSLSSCQGIIPGEKLSDGEIKYIVNLGLLDKDEEIILFASQSSFEKSGNFFTDKRIGKYWVDNRPEETEIRFALYQDIDSIKTEDLTQAVTLASYIEIFVRDGSSFKVHVDDDKEMTQKFFDEAIDNWKEKKK